jgi:protein Mpv17
MIFKLLPGTSLFSTLQKAALGQIIFGPSFTCVFFATALLQSGTFSLGNWFTKIKNDLPGAWMAGLGFWPLVDLVSYSMIQPQWIPLFVNSCSLVWTIYLSLIANKTSSSKSA